MHFIAACVCFSPSEIGVSLEYTVSYYLKFCLLLPTISNPIYIILKCQYTPSYFSLQFVRVKSSETIRNLFCGKNMTMHFED